MNKCHIYVAWSCQQSSPEMHTENTKEREALIRRVWRDWALDWLFFSHLLLSHLQKQSSESHVTALCVFEPDISSKNPSSIKVSLLLSTPALLLSVTDQRDNVASLARENFPPYTSSSLPTPLRHSSKRAIPQKEAQKMCSSDPLSLSQSYWGEKWESGMLVLTSDKIPLPQGKQREYHPQSTQKTKSNK